jgi:hypothetical protein
VSAEVAYSHSARRSRSSLIGGGRVSCANPRGTPRSLDAAGAQTVSARIPRDAHARRERHVCAACAARRAQKEIFVRRLGLPRSRAIDAVLAVSRSRRQPIPAASAWGHELTARPFRAPSQTFCKSTQTVHSGTCTMMARRRRRSRCDEARACGRNTYGLFAHPSSTVPVWPIVNDGTYVLQNEQDRPEPKRRHPIRRDARCHSDAMIGRTAQTANNSAAMENRTVSTEQTMPDRNETNI